MYSLLLAVDIESVFFFFPGAVLHQGLDEKKTSAQAKLIARAKANSLAQLGKYDPSGEDESAAENMYVKNYSY